MTGTILTSMVKWFEGGAHNNKYFHNLEKLSHIKKIAITQEMMKGTILRSKARWFEDDSLNKYFYNLEKRCHRKKMT